MEIKDVLGKAFNLSNEWRFLVQIGDEEAKELTYLQLGIFITSNTDNIEVIKIKLRD